MTELLYLKDSYLREFSAKVVKSFSKGNKHYVILDKTLFYPIGGGQPSDKGFLEFGGKNIEVFEVTKKGPILHQTSTWLSKGDEVKGAIDWDLRYIYMKMHTAQHILSRIVLEEFNGKTVGNQIHADKSRLDFYPVTLTDENLVLIEQKANEIIKKELPVKIYEEKRSILEKNNKSRANFDLIPRKIDPLRVVEIEGFDICPCAGTHVKNTKEIGELRLLGKESKGKDRERLSFSLL